MNRCSRCQRFKSPAAACGFCGPAYGAVELPPSNTFEENWQRFNAWIGRHSTAAPTRFAERYKPANRKDILHVSDLHIPFLDEQALATIITDNQHADECVVGGDIFNAGSVSLKFTDRRFSDPRLEVEQTTRVLLGLAQTFKRVHVRRGNHVDRIRKFFLAKLPPYLMFLVQDDPLRFIVEGLAREGITNISLAENVVDNLPGSDWITIIGDAAFCHGESSAKGAVIPAQNVAKWLHKWRKHLPVMPRVVVQEHNHRGGKAADVETGLLLIQCPAICGNQEYQADPNLKGNPNQIGYVRIVQFDGITDWNLSDYVLTDY